MNFPPINGVDEGSLLYCVMCIVSGYFGSVDFWTQKHRVFGGIFAKNEMFVFILRRLLPMAAVVAMFNIYNKKHFSHFKQLWDVRYFIM